METKIIKLADFRKQVSVIWKGLKGKNVKYVVTVHNKPVLEVAPYKGDANFETLAAKAKGTAKGVAKKASAAKKTVAKKAKKVVKKK